MTAKEKTVNDLKVRAVNMRLDLLKMLEPGKVGHLGGSSSSIDIVAALYFHMMNIDPKNPKAKDRDYFLMSKGHSVPAQYAALGEAGFFDKKEYAAMKTLHGLLQGHPDMSTPGIEAVTGSLGQGLSISSGMAYGFKVLDKADNKVYVICGDGEMAEGQIWEAAAFAANYNLSNLTMILDQNSLQASGTCEEVMCIPDLAEKWASFGWDVIEIDGHDMDQIVDALEKNSGDRPKAIVASTVKGKGFPFAENVVGFHNGAMTQEQYDLATAHLNTIKEELLR